MRKILLCLLLVGCDDPPKSSEASAAAAPIRAQLPMNGNLDKMGDEFDQSPVAADSKYRGRLVAFSGLYRGAEVMDNGGVAVGIMGIPHGAICIMDDGERDKVGQLVQGRIYMVRLVGTFTGFRGKVMNFAHCTLAGSEDRTVTTR